MMVEQTSTARPMVTRRMVRRLEAVYAAVASLDDLTAGGRGALLPAPNLDSLEECR